MAGGLAGAVIGPSVAAELHRERDPCAAATLRMTLFCIIDSISRNGMRRLFDVSRNAQMFG
jgi:hypothetical protein